MYYVYTLVCAPILLIIYLVYLLYNFIFHRNELKKKVVFYKDHFLIITAKKEKYEYRYNDVDYIAVQQVKPYDENLYKEYRSRPIFSFLDIHPNLFQKYFAYVIKFKSGVKIPETTKRDSFVYTGKKLFNKWQFDENMGDLYLMGYGYDYSYAKKLYKLLTSVGFKINIKPALNKLN